MGRGLSKKIRQPEKILLLLITAYEQNKEVSLDEIKQTLGEELKMYRFPTYLWNLKMVGAEILKRKVNRVLVGFTFNSEENYKKMKEYAISRGFLKEEKPPLSTQDFTV